MLPNTSLYFRSEASARVSTREGEASHSEHHGHETSNQVACVVHRLLLHRLFNRAGLSQFLPQFFDFLLLLLVLAVELVVGRKSALVFFCTGALTLDCFLLRLRVLDRLCGLLALCYKGFTLR